LAGSQRQIVTREGSPRSARGSVRDDDRFRRRLVDAPDPRRRERGRPWALLLSLATLAAVVITVSIV
jgi:hypothetical protein